MYARVRVVVVSDDGALAGALVRSGSGDSAVVALTDQTGSASLRLHAGTHRIIATKLGFAPTRSQ